MSSKKTYEDSKATTNYYNAKYVHSKPKGTSSGDLKVHVPSIMPLIPMAKAKVWGCGLNKSIYNNAMDCKPAVSSQTSLQNFVTAKAPYEPYKKPIYYFGDNMEVITSYNDVLDCRIRELDIDESKSE